jgi:hypothetical protein
MTLFLFISINEAAADFPAREAQNKMAPDASKHQGPKGCGDHSWQLVDDDEILQNMIQRFKIGIGHDTNVQID